MHESHIPRVTPEIRIEVVERYREDCEYRVGVLRRVDQEDPTLCRLIRSIAEINHPRESLQSAFLFYELVYQQWMSLGFEMFPELNPGHLGPINEGLSRESQPEYIREFLDILLDTNPQLFAAINEGILLNPESAQGVYRITALVHKCLERAIGDLYLEGGIPEVQL